jgi:hypothetical protein
MGAHASLRAAFGILAERRSLRPKIFRGKDAAKSTLEGALPTLIVSRMLRG